MASEIMLIFIGTEKVQVSLKISSGFSCMKLCISSPLHAGFPSLYSHGHLLQNELFSNPNNNFCC